MPRKVTSNWRWQNSVVALFLCIDLCAVTWYLWELPESFGRTEKVVSTVASWVVSLLAFFGVKKATKKTSFAAFLNLPPVGLCTLAITVGVWLFVLPFHGFTVSVVAAGTRQPLADANVTVDTNPLQTGTDGTVRANGLFATNHNLKVERDGYNLQKTTVAFTDVLRNRNIPVALSAKTGTIKATSNPSAAAIYLDGNGETVRGYTPDPLEVDAGRHTVRLAKAGFKPTEWVAFEIQGGQQKELPLRTLQRQPGPAKEYPVMFASEPSGAIVEVDGKRRGKTPIPVPLTLGRHSVRYRLGNSDCGAPETIQVPPYAHLGDCGSQP
jgi:hypothetical protein